ncbi:MAG TPA: hypothetical protein VNR18_14500 [Hyphomicrobiales bacterium]|nr:hypothetical protein [Hyphomicrobiales bacterium]
MNAMGLWLAICLGLCTPVGQQGESAQGLIPVLEFLGSLSETELAGVVARAGGENAAVATQADTTDAEPVKVQTTGQVQCEDAAAHCAEQPVLEGAVSHATTLPAGAADAAL